MDGTLHQIIKVAKLYYEDGLTQQAIAERLRLSRPKISRLLQQARDDRIVQITIAPPFGAHTDLERQLETCYGLEEALVVDVTHPDASALVMRELGAAAADYFSHILQDHDIVGLTWGGTLAAMVDALPPRSSRVCGLCRWSVGWASPVRKYMPLMWRAVWPRPWMLL
jgi:DNA-binding transcriptional regulator LsrR (DeoR family)